jgi:hypothetical protein
MAKAYWQDLRGRVIDAVERVRMSRRAAARRYEISESVAVKWLERYPCSIPPGGMHRLSQERRICVGPKCRSL